MIKNSIVIFSLIFLFFSCKKDTTVSPPVTNFSNITSTSVQDTMLPLAVGNYWIYQKSNDDTLGNLNLQNEYDSVYVEKDTFIIGEHYYKLRHINPNFREYYFFDFRQTQYIKDSSGYIVAKGVGILLDKTHMHDTIQRDVYSSYDYSCLVPDYFYQRQFVIGNYSGLTMNRIYIDNHPSRLIFDTACAQMFVDKIGIVRAFYYFSGCERRCWFSNNLIRYHIN